MAGSRQVPKQAGEKSESRPSYLVGLNEGQLAAVEHSGSNLLVHAGAGSGKTRVVISRIIRHILEEDIAPWNILAVTFTNRAAREMRDRLAGGLGSDGQELSERVMIRTFHSFGVWFLRRHPAAGLASSFSIYDDEDAQALLKQAWVGIGKKAKLLHYAIARAKESGLSYDLPPGSHPSSSELEEYDSDPDFPEAFVRYQDALRRSGNVDFADLLGLPLWVLQQHREVQQQVQRRFHRILVDEYQDSNPLQNRLLHLLLGDPQTPEAASGQEAGDPPAGTRELCIVGDEDQSIYGFRGAEIRHILEFEQNFAPARIIKLEQNYRSCAPILDLANQVIGHNRQRLGKNLRATKPGGRLPQFHHFENHEDEAVFVVQCIREKPELRSAILYRTNAQSRTFERVFREWNMPYRLVGNLSFYRREEVKDVVAYLKCLANPRDLVSFGRIYNKPKRGLGPRVFAAIEDEMLGQEPIPVDVPARTGTGTGTPAETEEYAQAQPDRGGVLQAIEAVLKRKDLALARLRELEKFAKQYRALTERLSPVSADAEQAEGPLLAELFQEVLERSDLLNHYQGRDESEGSERCRNFDSLLEEVRHYGRGIKALVAFLESIELETEELDSEEAQGRDGKPRRAEQQTLITMHNTKGLEFQRVFVTGLELGVFPKFDALSEPNRMEEERRLFYVAITRAEEELYLSAAKNRFLYGRTEYHELSPLLSKVDSAFYEDCRVGSSGNKGKDRDEAVQNRSGESHRSEKRSSDLSGCRQLSDDKLNEILGHSGLKERKGQERRDGLKKESAKESASDPYVVGARVDHLDYGLGYVVQRKHSGDITTLMVKLDDGRLIRVQLEFQAGKLDFLGTGL
ncbi:UvrD-helicase domain-containing protein [Candidatus Haliotispira prima]|uniref:DNA 3'-5' helicase n=1 Tax=Candidatus Haliotispira prima TaxID=3034016 RepID=A0ABY8MF20_9SPIO|nr:UvrD-helicase domain-containing protein [Candidatus Haliotispira prima]